MTLNNDNTDQSRFNSSERSAAKGRTGVNQEPGVNRREFLGRTAASLLIAGSLGSAEKLDSKNGIPHRTLGRTGDAMPNVPKFQLNFGVNYTAPISGAWQGMVAGDVTYSFPTHFLKGNLNLSSNIGYNKGKQFINGVGNNINTINLGPALRLDMSPTSKFDLSLISSLNYYETKYSLQSALNTKYLTQLYEADVDWQLPASFFLHTEFTYTVNSQRANGFNTKVPLWNASLSKQLLRFNRGEIKLSAYDLLNQNVGINRNTSQNYIEDVRTVILQRYFLVSFTYSLSKNGLGGVGGMNGGMHIIKQ